MTTRAMESPLGRLEPLEVLYFFEVPCIFTARDRAGGLLLLYLCSDYEDEPLEYLAASTSPHTLEELTTGRVSMRQALMRGSVWAVTCDSSGAPLGCELVEAPMGDERLPREGVMLWPDLEPALRYRVQGSFGRAGVPVSVMNKTVQAVTRSFKSLATWSARRLWKDTKSRPPDFIRSLYNPIATSTRFESFEVSFSEPRTLTPLADPVRDDVWRLLRQGLEWVSGRRDRPGDTPEECIAVMQALIHLLPPGQGEISKVSVSGARTGAGVEPYRLQRVHTRRVRVELNKAQSDPDEVTALHIGTVRELNLDTSTLLFRTIEDETEKLSFSGRKILASVKRAIDTESLVIALIEKSKTGSRLLEISDEPAGAEDEA